ncbi:S8 family serine peptidase [Candidatus Chlorohelix sp.]|uniref:S8 family serine peptidase n=1 Tax=Candidatus Chlorohelix sp. TaxID=3139201 RepID=UPI00304E5216
MDNSDKTLLQQLTKSGATELENYGSFSLWKTNKQIARNFIGRNSVTASAAFDTIGLREGSIDTTQPQPNAPSKLSQNKLSGKQLWLIQFYGPVKEDWINQLKKLGVEFVIYMPNNAYVVWLDGTTLTQVEGLVGRYAALQWSGAYHPAYRLSPNLQGKNAPTGKVAVTIQFYNHPDLNKTLASLQGTVIKPAENILNFVNLTVQIDASALANLASLPEVYNIEPWSAPIKLDEVQNQIIAGNITTSSGNVVPSGVGYLNWLAAKGFPTTASSYPIISVVDDGLDNGSASPLHPDFYTLGSKTYPSRITAIGNCTSDFTGNGVAGHGNINTGIVGSYNNLTGSPYQDTNGYRLGLGVSPYGRMAHVKIFNNAGSYAIENCLNTDAGVVAVSYDQGAWITSNSWGSNVAGAYDSSSQAYDALTRDAVAGTAGNQQMLHVFSAGNAGSGTTTIGSPGTAKNVLTVGATENVRDEGILDGCGISSANNADDMASFSSRGPTSDLRVKPDIVAPGIHIQGPASQDLSYDGTGVCGPKYYPTGGQTLYTWSSGTSHSAPAVAGAASLVYNYYNRVLNPGNGLSPAMLKGLILNTPRYLNGSGTGDTLPSPNQGWGDVNLDGLTDGTPRILVDQTTTLTATGQTYTSFGTISTSSKPFNVTLAWTDAPGSTTGNSFVNNLDLEVTVGGQVYKGNVFSGGYSTTSGSADTRNNVENVFIPAGITGNFKIKVTATNLAGDGVPGNATSTDQDFALIAYNGVSGTVPVLASSTPVFTQVTGNNDAATDPGETWSVQIPLANVGNATATGISSSLTVASGGATIINGTSAYPNIAADATQNNSTLFTFYIKQSQTCGAAITFTYSLSFSPGGGSFSYTLSKNIGIIVPGSFTTFTSTDVPKTVPDNTPGGIDSIVTVSGLSGAVYAVRVKLGVTMTWDSDLVFKITSPDNTATTLISKRGSNGANFTDTVLDDSAATAISTGSAPFTGSYRPESPLSVYNGQTSNGIWTLHIVDGGSGDIATLDAWSIDIQPFNYTCNVYTSVVTVTTDDGTGTVNGSLSKMINNVSVNGEITFNLSSGSVITVTGTLPKVPDGVTIDGGSCQNPVEIKGNNLYTGLSIGKNTTLIALNIHGFSANPLIMSGTGNKFSCLRLSKT